MAQILIGSIFLWWAAGAAHQRNTRLKKETRMRLKIKPSVLLWEQLLVIMLVFVAVYFKSRAKESVKRDIPVNVLDAFVI